MANVQDYELLLRVRADLAQALKGMDGLSASLGSVQAAANATGESAEQATERIRAMVQASAQQAAIQESARSQAERAAQTAQTIIRNYDAEAAAAKRAADAAADYRARTAARNSTSSTAAVALAAEREEMAKLAQQIDPTIRALAKLDAQEAALNAMRKSGVVGLEDYTRFKAIIDENRVSITNAGKAMHTFSLNTAQTRREVGLMVKDLATGQFGRLEQSALTLAGQTGMLTTLFNPLALAIGAVVGSLGLFVLAAAKGSETLDPFNRALAQTGNFAGQTAGQLEDMAHNITGANGNLQTSRDVLVSLVSSGRVGGTALQALGQAAVNMAELTGKSAQQAASEVLKMFDGTTASLLKANEQYHFLTTGVYDHIRALEEQGRTQEAMETAADAFNQAATERQRQLQNELSVTATWWDTVKAKARDAWEQIKGSAALTLGLAGDEAELAQLQREKMASQLKLPGGGGSVLDVFFGGKSDQWTDQQEAKLAALQAKVAKARQQARDAADQERLNAEAVNADAGLDRLAASIDKAYGRKAKLAELNKYFEALWAGADPNNAKLKGVQRVVDDNGNVSFMGGLYDTLKADIDKKFAPPTDRSGAARERAAQAAREQLIKALGDEQGALDPVAKAWAAYNDAVTKANDLAAKAKTAKNADVAAINGERDAYIAAAAQVRDAAIAKVADKDRQAFEKLRDSLKEVDGVSLGKIRSELAQLRTYLDKGTINPNEYQAAAAQVLASNLPKLPQFQGADALITGPFGELDKLDDQQQRLEAAYSAQLQALNEWHERTLDSDQAFVEKENALYQAHAEQLQKIDNARNAVMLRGITDSLSQAADALRSSYGEQSTAYRAAFALAKAAAIAEGTVKLHQAILNAMGDLPYPANIAAMASVAAQGISLLSTIASVNPGYREGGYTGPGAVDQPAGVVHRGEVVWSQADIARAGGVHVVEAMRLGYRGYADGGLVGPSTAGFGALREPTLPADIGGRGGAGQGAGRGVRIINVPDKSGLKDYVTSSEDEKVIVNVIGRNKSDVRAVLGI